MLQQDSYQCVTSVSPICDCGAEVKSTEHFLLYVVIILEYEIHWVTLSFIKTLV